MPVVAPPAPDKPQEPEHEFDFDSMQLTNEIAECHQEGNWLIAVSKNGIRFRQHIPQGKRLNKKGDRFVLEDMVIG